MIVLSTYDGKRFSGMVRGHGNLKGCHIIFDGQSKKTSHTLYGRARDWRLKGSDGRFYSDWSFISLDKRGSRVVVKTAKDGKDYPMDEFCGKYYNPNPDVPAEVSFYPKK